MGWRDLVVTSQLRTDDSPKPTKGNNFEDFEDFEPRYTKLSSLSLKNSPQISIEQKPSSISSKLPVLVPPDLVALKRPQGPIHPGRLVVYRAGDGKLRGGADERAHGMVKECRWEGTGFIVILTNGQHLPLRAILTVARTDDAGCVVSAWTVREYGYDGVKNG